MSRQGKELETGQAWIQRVTLSNVGPFGGTRTFEFTKGPNIFAGPGGSGKTRLLRHIAAAWTGNLADDGEIERDFSVRVETDCGAAEISDSGDGWERTRSWTRPEGWDAAALLLVDGESLGPLAETFGRLADRGTVEFLDRLADKMGMKMGGESAAEHAVGALRALCAGNCAGKKEHGIILLDFDTAFPFLDRKNRGEILGLLAKHGSQVILTTKHEVDISGANVVRLEAGKEGKTRVIP